MSASNLLVSATTPLQAKDAVAALLVVEDGGYLLQQRDNLPAIWYPDHWGLFGGAVEPGEDMITALRRELQEELELVPRQIDWFTRFDFDLTGFGQGQVHRTYFTIPVQSEEVAQLRLHEGAAVQAFGAAEIFGGLKMTPYDAFALWLHHARLRLSG